LDASLQPTYRCCLGAEWLLWFEAVNRYSVVDADFLKLIDLYASADNDKAFRDALTSTDTFDTETAQSVLTDLKSYLQTANSAIPNTDTLVTPAYRPGYGVSTTYRAYGQGFKIEADRSLLLSVLAGSWQHLKYAADPSDNLPTFSISEDPTHLHLYLNGTGMGSYPKSHYHQLQGRLAILLLGILHGVSDEDWLAAFHASTVAKNGQALMLTGHSGQGKSTLSALLTHAGFTLVADDLTGMDAEQQVYGYPAAVSVKGGAFAALNAVFKELADIPIADSHKKGPVKYLPVPQGCESSFPCKHLLLVHYHPAPMKAQLKAIDMSVALEVVIPDTWLSPKKAHAKRFLKWLQTVKTYELHYHDYRDAAEILHQLVKS
jgi:hypothetical protein